MKFQFESSSYSLSHKQQGVLVGNSKFGARHQKSVTCLQTVCAGDMVFTYFHVVSGARTGNNDTSVAKAAEKTTQMYKRII